MSTTRHAIRVAARPESLATLHALLHGAWDELERERGFRPDAMWRAGFETAAAEICANIIRHAYNAAAGGDFSFHVRVEPGRVIGEFEDGGDPFDELPPQSPPALSDLAVADLPEGGFGLVIARATVDDVRYWRTADGLNHWLIEKRTD